MKNSMTIVAALVLPLLTGTPASAQSMAVGDAPPMAGYGTAVAVGENAVFVGEGANVMRPGMVYVYRPDGSGLWSEWARLTAPTVEAGDGFGRALAVAGDHLFVGQVTQEGAGTVHVFRERGSGYRHVGRLHPESLPEDARYGASLAVGGGLVAVGAAAADDGAGRVYIFERSRDGWAEVAQLRAADPRPGDAFGAAISIDGNRMLVGSPGRGQRSGTAAIFRRDPGTGEWSEEATLEGRGVQSRSAFGSGVILGAGLALVAAPGLENATGAVFEFVLDAVEGEWSQGARFRPFDGGRGDRFGAALSARPDGAYVGAPGAGESGTIYVIRRLDGRWTGVDKIAADQVEPGGNFGATLAMGPDVGVAGATGEDFGAGAAVILAWRGGQWQAVEKVASEPETMAAITGGETPCEAGVAAAFACEDVDLQSFLPVTDIGGERGVWVNDIWGWTDPETGREYALVGRTDGTSFVDVTDPARPRYLGDLPMTPGSHAAVWRDIKVYDGHALIVADGAGQHGMQVFDLTRLRNVPEVLTFDADAYYDRIASAHNIVMDTASGFAFAVGARGGGETCGGGLHMIDVRDPKRPRFAGCFSDPQTGRASTGYSHDAQCVTYRGPDEDYRGREICLGANETALSIADVTDKDEPVAVARAAYPNVGYAHQGWLTEDHRYFYMNDELDELQGKTPRTRTLIWDVTDLDDPQLAGEYLGTTAASDHNLYIRGDLMFQSNYQAGLQIIDITDRENPRQVGHFDTVPYGENTPSLGGSWSNYPFFPSGTIVVTSEREGLFVLRKRGPIS